MGEQPDKDLAAPVCEPEDYIEPAQEWAADDCTALEDDTVRVSVLRILPPQAAATELGVDLVDTVRVRVLRPGMPLEAPTAAAPPRGVDPYRTDTAPCVNEKARRTLDDMRKLSDEIKRARLYLKD